MEQLSRATGICSSHSGPPSVSPRRLGRQLPSLVIQLACLSSQPHLNRRTQAKQPPFHISNLRTATPPSKLYDNFINCTLLSCCFDYFNWISPLGHTAATMPGFDFSNYNRNAALHARGVPLPKATSTGTTIVGCIFDGGVVVSEAPNIIVPFPSGRLGNLQPTVSPVRLNLELAHLANIAFTECDRSQPTPEPHQVPSSPTRTAKSCTTSPPRSGAPAPVPPPTPNSQPPSSRQTWNCTRSRRAASPA